jgi:hypothetical protein
MISSIIRNRRNNVSGTDKPAPSALPAVDGNASLGTFHPRSPRRFRGLPFGQRSVGAPGLIAIELRQLGDAAQCAISEQKRPFLCPQDVCFQVRDDIVRIARQHNNEPTFPSPDWHSDRLGMRSSWAGRRRSAATGLAPSSPLAMASTFMARLSFLDAQIARFVSNVGCIAL